MCAPVIHPDIAHLQRQCRDLRGRIRAVTEEWHRLSSIERPRLNALYDTYFGVAERDYQRLALDTAELFRRVELLSIKVARGERLTQDIIDHINRVVDKEYARFHQRIHEAFDMHASERDAAANARAEITTDDEVAKTYRILVKKLHPDVVRRPTASAVAAVDPLWQQVQDAYGKRDLAQLRSLLAVLEADVTVDAQTSGWSVDRLHREVAVLNSRLDMEQRKLVRLQSSEPLSLASELDDPSWRSQHLAELQNRYAAKQREYDETLRRYVEITGRDLPSGQHPNRTPQERQEEQDFMENTYFKSR